jgi:hypothetical protein
MEFQLRSDYHETFMVFFSVFKPTSRQILNIGHNDFHLFPDLLFIIIVTQLAQHRRIKEQTKKHVWRKWQMDEFCYWQKTVNRALLWKLRDTEQINVLDWPLERMWKCVWRSHCHVEVKCKAIMATARAQSSINRREFLTHTRGCLWTTLCAVVKG